MNTFAGKTFAAKTFEAETFRFTAVAVAVDYLRTFYADSFDGKTFAAGTFRRPVVNVVLVDDDGVGSVTYRRRRSSIHAATIDLIGEDEELVRVIMAFFSSIR